MSDPSLGAPSCAVLARVRAAGVVVTLQPSGALRWSAAPGVMTGERRAWVASHRASIVAALVAERDALVTCPPRASDQCDAARRVRPRDGSCAAGRVTDTLDDGWVAWTGDDKLRHISAPDYVEDEPPHRNDQPKRGAKRA